jgi:hypothetical protein
VPGPTRPHLDHDGLHVVGRLEQRQRHTDLVVERAVARLGVERGGEHHRNEVLRRGLPDGAGDADDAIRQVVTCRGAEPFERERGVVDEDRRATQVAAGAEVRRGTGRQGVRHEVVTVALGDDRHEQLAGPERAGVLRRAVHDDVGTGEEPRRRGRWRQRADAWWVSLSVARPGYGGIRPLLRPGDRIKLIVLFGGRSAEHEVSRVTAATCCAIDPRAL